MINLLEETKDDIKRSGHSPKDIIFIGSQESGYSCTWDEFCKLADQEYNNGSGANEVVGDLIIVFSDGATMWRGEYDGSEWWNFSKPFKMPLEHKSITNLFVNSYESTLKELHEKSEE